MLLKLNENEFWIINSFTWPAPLFPLSIIWLPVHDETEQFLRGMHPLRPWRTETLCPKLPTPYPHFLHTHNSVKEDPSTGWLSSRTSLNYLTVLMNDTYYSRRLLPGQITWLFDTETLGKTHEVFHKTSTDGLCPMMPWIPVSTNPELWQVPALKDPP